MTARGADQNIVHLNQSLADNSRAAIISFAQALEESDEYPRGYVGRGTTSFGRSP